MVMDNPHAPRRTCVTIKVPESSKWAGDNPWLVFEGSPKAVREQIIETFGLEDVEGLTLFDVTLNAQQVATNQGSATQRLGGRVLAQGKPSEGNPQSEAEKPSETPPKADPLAGLKAAVESAQFRDDLKRLWAENRVVFDDNPDLFAEWKAKGKSLPS